MRRLAAASSAGGGHPRSATQYASMSRSSTSTRKTDAIVVRARTNEVRAWSLHEALMKADTLPLRTWFEDEDVERYDQEHAP